LSTTCPIPVTLTDRAIVLASVFARDTSSLSGLQRVMVWKFPSPTCPAITPVSLNSLSYVQSCPKVYVPLDKLQCFNIYIHFIR